MAAAAAAGTTLLLVLLLPAGVLSQTTNGDTTTQTTSLNGPMAVLIAVLITAFFFMGFFSVYLRQCTIGLTAENDRSNDAAPRAASSRSRRSRGLDPSILASFPALLYSDVKLHKLGKSSLECAVCLEEFADDDSLRLLPHCSHAFHPDCIEMWLSTHTTCPVCRHNLALPAPSAAEDPAADPPSEPEADHVIIQVQPISSEAPEGSTGGSRRFRVPALWRSKTTARVQWGEAERERFTLRLPDHVRREVMEGKLRRSATVAVGEGRERRGLRGEGSSKGWRSMRLRRESAGKSDRWTSVLRQLSIKFNKGGGGGEEDRSVKRGGEGEMSTGKAVPEGAPAILSPRSQFPGTAEKDFGSGSVLSESKTPDSKI